MIGECGIDYGLLIVTEGGEREGGVEVVVETLGPGILK